MKTNRTKPSHRAVLDLVLLLPLLLLSMPATVQAEDYTYTNINGTITITRYTDPTGPSGAVNIPSTINGLPVTSIGDSAFGWCSSLSSVMIPNSVTNIGSWAFSGCSSLTSITIPNSVTTIRNAAFSYCSGLSSVSIPDSITNIDTWAFGYCTGLTNVTIGNSVTSIGGYAFYSCTRLTNITIPNRVTSIGGGAFKVCSSLTSVTIPNSVTSIGAGSFANCSSLTAIKVNTNNPTYTSVDGVLFNKSQTALIQYPGGRKAGGYTIPDSVTSLEGGWSDAEEAALGAFSYCAGLTNVTIGNSVIRIGDAAFYSCPNLTSVTIPNNVTSIGDYAFNYCTSLTGVYFQGNAPSIVSNAFYNANKATVYYLPGTTGWGPKFGGRPTALWKLRVQTGDASFGVRTNQFGFNIAWASGRVVVVEASQTLVTPIWVPISTNTLTGGSAYFSDAEWTNYPGRFYRLRSP